MIAYLLHMSILVCEVCVKIIFLVFSPFFHDLDLISQTSDYSRVMLLTYQIPTITILLLSLTIIVNIAGISLIGGREFDRYLTEVSQEKDETTVDPALLQSITHLDQLDESKRREYEQAIAELTQVSTAIEDISRNPGLYSQSPQDTR